LIIFVKFSNDSDAWRNAVGLESGHIMDSQLSANDFYALAIVTSHGLGPWSGRLNHDFIVPPNRQAFWGSTSHTLTKEFWQIDLLLEHDVTAVVTQGRPMYYDQWVTKFEVSLSNDSFSWIYVLSKDGSNKVSRHI
jgi:hypothetical protein